MSPHSAFMIEKREIPFAKDIIKNLLAISQGLPPENQIDLERGY